MGKLAEEIKELQDPVMAQRHADQIMASARSMGYVEVDQDGVIIDRSAPGAPDRNFDFVNPNRLRCFARAKVAASLDGVGPGRIYVVGRGKYEVQASFDQSGIVRILGKKVDLSARLPQLMLALQQLQIPPRTVLLGHVSCAALHPRALFGGQAHSVARRVRELPPSEQPRLNIHFVPIWNGVDLATNTMNWCERLEQLRGHGAPEIEIADLMFGGPDEPRNKALALKDGFVLALDPNRAGTVSFGIGYTPRLPGVCWRPEPEDQFLIVYDPDNAFGNWKWGGTQEAKGHSPKRFALYQRGRDGDTPYYVGQCIARGADLLKRCRDLARDNAGVVGIGRVRFGRRDRKQQVYLGRLQELIQEGPAPAPINPMLPHRQER
jgi:hypothetical protein